MGGQTRRSRLPAIGASASRESGVPSGPRRGRPSKFGRPSQVVALTLPEDVIEALRGFHRDLGWAIVRLVESTNHGPLVRHARRPVALAELVHLPGGRALIVVQPKVFDGLQGVSTIPLADGRAFLALDAGGGLADLELAILDRIDALPEGDAERGVLVEVRTLVRTWRRDPGLSFKTKTVIVVEGSGGQPRHPLSGLRAVGASADAAAGSADP